MKPPCRGSPRESVCRKRRSFKVRRGGLQGQVLHSGRRGGSVRPCDHRDLFPPFRDFDGSGPGDTAQETKAGILGIEIQADGTVFMEQTLPVFDSAIDGRDVAASLGIGPDSLAPDMPVQIVSTGLRDTMVPVVSLRELSSLEPDFDKITEISRKLRSRRAIMRSAWRQNTAPQPIAEISLPFTISRKKPRRERRPAPWPAICSSTAR